MKKARNQGPRLGEQMSVPAIAARLGLLRQAMGWNQTVMAQRLGIQLSRWNNYELAVSPIPWDVASRLCLLTGASLDWIYQGRPGLMPVKLMGDIEQKAASNIQTG